MMFPAGLVGEAEALLSACRQKNLRIVTAESCTGGLVAVLLTSIAGSSDVFDRGFVTYSNDAKREMLAVHDDLLSRHGAVSGPVARAMAEGALMHSAADVAVSITGIAGPGGGSGGKPIGLVHFACSRRGGQTMHERHLFGDIGRDAVREEAARRAIGLMARAVS